MKYILLISISVMAGWQVVGQCPFSDTIDRPQLDTIVWRSADSIRADIRQMYDLMDSMNKTVFYPLLKEFDTVAGGDNDSQLNQNLYKFLDTATPKLEKMKIAVDSQFYRLMVLFDQNAKPYERRHWSCFYYKMHKEIEDFKGSIDLLEKSINQIVLKPLISTVAKVQFLNSYYYLSISRSLLLARMNNLENEIVLFRPYAPYPPDKHTLWVFKYPDSNALKVRALSKDQDKITSAADAVIDQTRRGPRNWFLKTMGASATGAILVYFAIALFRGHK